MKRAQTALAGLVAAAGALVVVVAGGGAGSRGQGADHVPGRRGQGQQAKGRPGGSRLQGARPGGARPLEGGRERSRSPGVGVFQVVRVDGTSRPDRAAFRESIPARNFVEFVPTADLNAVANAPGRRSRHGPSRGTSNT